MKGKFITFEGCEGVGKSTQIKLLCKYFEDNKIDYVATREPGGSNISEQIRKIILDGKNTAMTDSCEALLYAASRAQLLEEKLQPILDSGKLVLCDRFYDSSLAYQGYARGLGVEFVKRINSFAVENFRPDCTIFLDLPPKEAFKRKGGADKNDRIELFGLEFHQKVYEGYKKLAEDEPDRIAVIDASGSIEQIQKAILNALKERGVI